MHACTALLAEAVEKSWYATPDWWVAIATVLTFGAIIYQSRESARATRAMQQSTAMQEVQLKQWLEVDKWSGKMGSFPTAEMQQGVLNIRFFIENNTTMPLTLIAIECRWAEQKQLSSLRVVVPPNKDYKMTFSVGISKHQLDLFLSLQLVCSVAVEITYVDAFGKRQEQEFKYSDVIAQK